MVSTKWGTGGRYLGFRKGPHAGKAEHTVVAERALGRSLPPGAEVHHIDENPANNLPSNLVVCQDHQYHMLIHHRMNVLRSGGNPDTHRICHQCRLPRLIEDFHVRRNRSGGRQSKCKECYRRLFREKIR